MIFLVKHRVPGSNEVGMPNFDLYLSTERPSRAGTGVEFTGWKVVLDRPHRHEAAKGYRLVDRVPRWRELPSRAVTLEEPPPHLALPDLPSTVLRAA